MLDQNVPNPLAKNPNFHTHKVFAAIGIILIVIIMIGGGIWYFVQSAEDKAGTVDDTTITKVSTNSAKPKIDETVDWKTFTSNKWGFSIKYPKDWESAKDTNTGALIEQNRQEYGHPQVYFFWDENASWTTLFNRINSYEFNKEITFNTDMELPESTTSAKKYIQDKYIRLADSKVDGYKALRYIVDFGYKDVGVNDSYNVLIVKSNRIYQVRIVPFDLQLQGSITKLDLMLSTFKFL